MDEQSPTGKSDGSRSSSSNNNKKSSPLGSLEHFGRLREPSCRWLPPVVLAALVALLLAACGGVALSGLVFSGVVEVRDPCLAQSFVLFASMLAFPYVYLHIWSSVKNYSMLRTQSFQHPLHSWTTIAAWADLVAWVPALITVCVDVSRRAGEPMHLRLDLFVSALAFVCALVAAATVTKAADPFVLPIITPTSAVLSRANTLVGGPEESAARRGSDEKKQQQQQQNKRSPVGPRPLGRSRRRSIGDEEKGQVPVGGAGGGVGFADATGPGPRLSWSSVYQQQLEELERIRQRQPTASYQPHHHRQPVDWRQEWSALENDAGLRRDGSASLTSSSTGSLPFVTGPGSGPATQQHQQPPSSLSKNRGWGWAHSGGQPPRLPAHGGMNNVNDGGSGGGGGGGSGRAGPGPRRASSGAARRPRLPVMLEEVDGSSPPGRGRPFAGSLPRTDGYHYRASSASLPSVSARVGNGENLETWGSRYGPGSTAAGFGQARPAELHGGNLPTVTTASHVKVPGAYVEDAAED